jgi:RNA polymerase sigma factor (sigma-70 family)
MWTVAFLSTNFAGGVGYWEQKMPDDAATTTSAPNPHGIWVEAVKNLQPEAWEDLLKYYAEELRRDIEISLRKRSLPPDLIGDIEQETWLTAVRKIKDFTWESDEKFYRWLRVISLNHVRTYGRLRSQSFSIDDFREQDSDYIGSAHEFFEALLSQEGSLEDEVILKEEFLALDQALRPLKPEAREIFLRWLMGETPKQLALVYKIKPHSISQGISRIKQQIRENLERRRRKDNHDD